MTNAISAPRSALPYEPFPPYISAGIDNPTVPIGISDPLQQVLREYVLWFDHKASAASAQHDPVGLEFESLASRWSEEMAFESSPTALILHPAYQRIIGLGNAVVPFILQRLERAPDHWFWALECVTGENPVSKEDWGDVERMREAWLQWGRKPGSKRS